MVTIVIKRIDGTLTSEKEGESKGREVRGKRG